MKIFLPARLVLWPLLLLSSPVIAQDWLGSYLDSKNFERQLERSQGVGSPNHPEKKPAMVDAAPATRPQSAPLRRPMSAQAFQPSVTVQKRVAQQFAAVLTGSTVNEPAHALDMLQTTFARHEAFRALLAREAGTSREQIASRLATDAQEGYAKSLASYGYSARDFTDVSNAFLASAWSIVNGRPLNRTETYAALRRAPGSRRGPAAMSETDRQRNAQTLSLLTVLADAASRDQLSAAEREALKTGLDDFGQRMGVRLREVALTSRGFERR